MSTGPDRISIPVSDSLSRLIFKWAQHQLLPEASTPRDYAAHIDHVQVAVDHWTRMNESYRLLVGTKLAAIALAEVLPQVLSDSNT